MPAPLITMSAIRKVFGPVIANHDVSLDIRAGEVLALLGENGAGKSTLMKILYGFYQPDGGRIEIEGSPVTIGSPRDAMARGIGMVFQQFSLVPALSVLENLLAALPNAPWLQRRSGPAMALALRWLTQLAPDLDPYRPVRSLSVGERQLVELAKVLNLDASVVILDEPTSVLTPSETERLYGFIKRLAADGKAVVLITHKLADIAACADRIVVMRGGGIIDQAAASDRSLAALVEAMVGQGAMGALEPPKAPASHVPILQVRHLSAEHHGRTIRDISFELAAGEILGIAGVSGNGQFTLAETLAGLVPVTDGDIVLAGVSIASHTEDEGTAGNVAYIPERPIDNAVIADLDLSLNLSLRGVRKFRFFPSRREIKRRASQLIADYDVRPPQPELNASALSGGNLQKLVIAREMSREPQLVIACYPTMGLDVLATQAIYREMFRHAAKGACVVWISEELDDLMSYAHCVAVIHDGRIAGIVRREDADRQTLGRWMAGHSVEAA
ncbi:ABC transporter ATP-binding protein [Bradyrhizobium sp. 200]|uniref:ABC transporter ATP-binding protein n=1 Tax=Bradyrhizobium sp. 200 TaxID=2782665 RepID=UPI001FFE78F7|nr:ABC transporter ATP-binding protein [Bradyrhizobium sp. 200]UPJ51415.1 ABC transporter ATP-binding protein [Bradyrhizobium sp. 200]